MSALVKIKYVGSTDGGFVNDAVYFVLGWDGDKPIVLGSNDVIVASGSSISDPAKWELVSITYPGEVQIYP